MVEKEIIENKPEGANLFLRVEDKVYYYRL